MSEVNKAGTGTKNRRLTIRRLVAKEKIRTQNDLARRLREEGFSATQATISRDIREMGLIKVSDAQGKTCYTLPEQREHLHATEQLSSLYKGAISRIDRAGNLIVIHTGVGLAQGVCAVIDRLGFENVLGTLAGDDTILVIADNERSAARVMEVLEGI